MKLRNAISIILVITLIVSIGFFSYRRAVHQKKLADIQEKLNDELWEAVGENDIALVKDLLEKGADPQKGLIAASSWNNKEIVKLMLDKGANPNKYKDDPPLTTILGTSHEDVFDVVELLVSHGAYVNYKIPSANMHGVVLVQGYTPLMLAALHNRVDVVKFLISKGAEIDTQSDSGYTALSFAVDRGNNEIVSILLSSGADVNNKRSLDEMHVGSGIGYTPLGSAVRNNRVDLVEFLISKGANINDQMSNGITALNIAVCNDNDEIISILLASGADISFYDAIGLGHLDKVKEFVKRGVDVNALVLGGRPLIMATERGHTEVLAFLLEEGADVNEVRGGYRILLELAICEGYVGVVEVFIENGAEINSKLSPSLATLLFIATVYGQKEIVELLISKGTDVNGITKWEKRTPLDIAEEEGKDEIAEILRKHGGKRSSELTEIE